MNTTWNMGILHGQKLCVAFGQPFPRRRALAHRAISIAPTIEGDSSRAEVQAACLYLR